MTARKRTKVEVVPPSPDIYGLGEFTSTKTFSTGCTLLDCVLGGGYAYQRFANIIGNKSTGKTLLAIEGAANFIAENPGGKIIYAETEAAFDRKYAATLGLPMSSVEFPEVFTVEQLYADIESRLAAKEPTLYIVDSLDALSDDKEMARDMGDASYGAQKAKAMSEWMRKQQKRMMNSNMTGLLISQIRDNVGAMFGKKYTRSGGHALDFYATHCLWLTYVGKIESTKKGVKRATGVRIRAVCEKNKIGNPFRECEFPLLFGYGVDDAAAGLAWLIEVKRTDDLGISAVDAAKLLKGLDKLNNEDYDKERDNINSVVKRVWQEIEESFAPVRSKY